MVAVGKRVAPLPPHRSRRALLTRRAPPSGRTSDGERFGRAHRPAHNRQSDRRRYPALCPDCGRLTAVPLGPGPSLHVLRRKLPSIVRAILRYYGPVRLLTHVHVQRTALAVLNRPEPKSGRELDLPGSTQRTSPRAWGLRLREVHLMLAYKRMGRCCLLFSRTRSARRKGQFRSSIPSPWSPL